MLILIGNYNVCDVCTHVIQSIIKLNTVMFRIQGKFKYNYTNNNTVPQSSVAQW